MTVAKKAKKLKASAWRRAANKASEICRKQHIGIMTKINGGSGMVICRKWRNQRNDNQRHHEK